MKEEFLHYVWKYRLMNKDLRTKEDEEIIILSVGEQNLDGGPDFFNAKIKLAETIWVGNVEIHIKASDWYTHQHHKDEKYDNIILHIVFDDDKEILNSSNESIPTLILKDKIPLSIFNHYSYLMENGKNIPCEMELNSVNRVLINNFLDRLLVERLENKVNIIQRKLEYYNNDWDQAFYDQMVSNFGFKVNTTPFELLARSLPLKILLKHNDNLFQLEALFYGQSGLLNKEFSDTYPQQLKREYEFLKRKYSLIPIESHLWQFFRMRPSNFPTIRIAQLSVLISKSAHILSVVLEQERISDLESLFDIHINGYWKNHFRFDVPSSTKLTKLGKYSIHLILINTIIPFIFIYGKRKNIPEIIDRSLKFLEQIPGEKNTIIKRWKENGFSTQTAYSTQALLQLFNNYCKNKRCLQCHIGNFILKNAINDNI